MRLVHLAVAAILTVATIVRTHAAPPPTTFVQYQGQRFDLCKAYEDFHDYKDDPANLTTTQVQRAESLMRSARFGPRFKTSDDLDAALAALEFPGFGLFYANQLGAHIDPKLEFAYVEIPRRNRNRYLALERQADGSFLVVADFVAAADPEITRVKRKADGSLEFRQRNGNAIIPAHR